MFHMNGMGRPTQPACYRLAVVAVALTTFDPRNDPSPSDALPIDHFLQARLGQSIITSTWVPGTLSLSFSSALTGTLREDSEWSQWSDREIARRCGVNHHMVSKARGSLGVAPSDDRTVRTKHGTVTTMDTANIGRGWPPLAAAG